MQQKQTIGAYYKKIFNEFNVDINNVAVYLEAISNGKDTALYNSAETVLNGNKSDSAIADMMLNGFEQSRDKQHFLYEKIGERLNENNRYTAYGLIRQYDKLSKNGIEFPQSIINTYNGLINTDENTTKNTFNYFVGKLSATMDAIIPRLSITAELIKKVRGEIKKDRLLNNSVASGENAAIYEKEFIEGFWEDVKSSRHNSQEESVENSNLKNVEKQEENGIIDYKKEKQENLDVNLLPIQIHHFSTNKSLKYTPQFNRIVSKYGLDLNGDWNKEKMRHLGRHPNEYHKFILYRMNRINELAKGNKEIFIEKFEQVKEEVLSKEQMLRKAYWKGEHNEVLQYDLRGE